ncbi:MAG: hypothetical protein QXQ66_08910, partial [Candidatus Hadarchaeum sp.]
MGLELAGSRGSVILALVRNNAMDVSETKLIALGQALAHPARVRILAILVKEEKCGCELAEKL